MVNYIYHRYKKEKKYWGIKKMFYLCRAKVGGNSSVVEHHLAKVRVAGPNPVFRSIEASHSEAFFMASICDR